LTVATLLLFCGPMGKSAQVPLHVWLPDAMEGPTPVSALIHAATMVAAGVYLLVKLSFLLAVVPITRDVIAWVGIVTSLLAALLATQQNDIKRILAYSTLSQLGYMICAVGSGASAAAMFHLFTHAYFKALLFLGAGAVIHAMHHEQNIWKMGGLARKMPITFWTFLVATLALVGCPPFAGYFSKDAVLEGIAGYNPLMGFVGLFVAFLTAFYMTRLFVVVFLNTPMSAQVEHAHEVPAVMSWPLAILALPAIFAGWGFVANRFGFADVHIEASPERAGAGLLAFVPMLALAAFVCGALLGFLLYRERQHDPVRVGLLRHKLYIDEFYAWLVGHTQDALARVSAWIDRWLIDGFAVRGISGGVWGAGFVLRFLQVGNLQAYAFFFGLGVLLLMYLAIL
jgi:NADH-quinone oxidoreductase subunit L